MIEITLFFIFIIIVGLKPTIIPYFALIYLFAVGITSPEIMDGITVHLGPVNVFPLDLLYAIAAIYSLICVLKIIFNQNFQSAMSSETKSISIFILLYVCFFIGKLINGFFNNLPLDNLVRLFMLDTQVLYFFLPLVMYKDINELKRLIQFTVVLSLLFPLFQPFLIYSAGTQFIIHGQGTFRLGYGDACILLATGAIALFCWEYKRSLIFLPLAGIMMLAHRSGYIGIVLSLMAVSFLKGKKIQSLIQMVIAGVFVMGLLVVFGSFTNIDILDKNLNRAGETFQTTGTTKARANILTTVIEEVSIRPLTGLTYKELQKFNDQTKSKNIKESTEAFNITHPHNFVYSAIFQTGIIGTVILLLLIFKSMRTSFQLAKTERFNKEGTFLFSSILFFIIFAAMNTTMGSVGDVLWFECGVTFLLLNQFKRDKSNI